MIGELDEREMYVVCVTDVLLPALVGHAGCHYESPPNPESEARLLVRVLLSSTRTPADAGPWLRPLAGRRRQVSLRHLRRTPRIRHD
jgi:hypothetical protein